MLFPKDKVIRIAEPSGLEQVGALLMKGDVRLMSFKFFLRYSTRRYGADYSKADEMLTDWHGTVGMPKEAKEEIREELNQVIEVKRKQLVEGANERGSAGWTEPIDTVNANLAFDVKTSLWPLPTCFQPPKPIIVTLEQRSTKLLPPEIICSKPRPGNKKRNYLEELSQRQQIQKSMKPDSTEAAANIAQYPVHKHVGQKYKRIYSIGHSSHSIEMFLGDPHSSSNNQTSRCQRKSV